MADKKISQLTSTTSANDNVWLVMNDSGDTQTFKIKRSDLLSGTTTPPGLVAGTGTNSIKSNLTSTPATASGDDSIAIGRDARATTQSVAIGGTTNVNAGGAVGIGYGLSSFGSYSVYIGNGIFSNGAEGNIGIGRDLSMYNGSIAIGNNQYAGQATRATGAQCVSIGQGIQQNQANYGTVVGRGLKINNSSAVDSFIYGGRDNTITTTNGRNGIIGGVGNTLSGTTSGTTLINLQGFTSPAQDNTTYVDNLVVLGNGGPGLVNGTGTDSVKSADFLTSVASSANGTGSMAIGKKATANGNNTIHLSNGNVLSTSNGANQIWIGGGNVFGGSGHISIGRNVYVGLTGNGNMAIGNECATYGTNAIAIGNEGSNSQPTRATANYALSIGTGNKTNQGASSILLGHNNEITQGNTGSVSIGRDNKITSTGDYNSIIGGYNNTLSGSTTYTTLLGLSNFVSPVLSSTTYVDNIHTLRTETFNVIAGGNVGGTVDVDCSLGTIYTFTMTADTTPNFINLRPGQRFMFIVDNTTFNVPDAQINGVSGNVYAKNGTISPSNNAITKYTATYDGTRLFLDEETGFSAV